MIENIILSRISPSDYLGLPRRPYDFNKGDRRFRSLKAAHDHADAVAAETSVRQVVRPDVDALGDGLYLVQAIGS